MAIIKPDELPEFMRVLNRANLKVIARSLIEFSYIQLLAQTKLLKHVGESSILSINYGLFLLIE
jgi:hypothetical protein